MYNSRQSFYKTPFGAVPVGERVIFRVKPPQEIADPRPVLEIFPIDAGEEAVVRVEMRGQAVPGEATYYTCTYIPQEAGVFQYRFRIQGSLGEFLLLRQPDSSAGVNQGGHWQLTVYEPFTVPAELEGAIFYQIFPDRFYNSGTPKGELPSGRIYHQSWDEEPVDRPDDQGKFLCNDYFGGDLEGIRQKLPYLAGLGVEVIYLNPIFEAHSNHRYNTADYRRIDPLLGTEEDFRSLCADAKKLGMKVVLDGVFNHTGSDSIYFNREKRYGEHSGACNDPDSPYRDWYSWTHWPDSYESWWGFVTLPNVNEGCEAYQEFICGEDGVLRKWMEAGASGFRLDVADELPDFFLEKIRAAVKSAGEDKLLLGEVWEDASNKFSYGGHRKYFMGRELDSVMNYPWRTAILRFLRLGEGQELQNAIMDILENYPRQVLGVLMNCLSTHDVPRCITALTAPDMAGKNRDWQRDHNTLTADQYYFGRHMAKLAALIQYTLPGCPSLYYGDEAGLVGYADPFNRGTYPWGHEDEDLLDFYRKLGSLHKEEPVIRRGWFTPLCFNDSFCVYQRYLTGKKESEVVLIAVNRSSDYQEIPWGRPLPADVQELMVIGGAEGIHGLHPRSAIVIKGKDPAEIVGRL